jgi:hypothetical protein
MCSHVVQMMEGRALGCYLDCVKDQKMSSYRRTRRQGPQDDGLEDGEA